MELISRKDTWREFISKIEDIADLEDIDKILSSMPTIEERKEGKWIKRDKWLYCSACDDGGWGLGAVTYEWQYCPLCGAKIGE